MIKAPGRIPTHAVYLVHVRILRARDAQGKSQLHSEAMAHVLKFWVGRRYG